MMMAMAKKGKKNERHVGAPELGHRLEMSIEHVVVYSRAVTVLASVYRSGQAYQKYMDGRCDQATQSSRSSSRKSILMNTSH